MIWKAFLVVAVTVFFAVLATEESPTTEFLCRVGTWIILAALLGCLLSLYFFGV